MLKGPDAFEGFKLEITSSFSEGVTGERTKLFEQVQIKVTHY